MNKIIKKIQYSEKVFRFDVEAPLIAKSRKAGNFVIIRVDNSSERMPLTIADADIEKGYPHRELRYRDLCRWWRRCSSHAPYHQGTQGSRQPCAQRDCW